MTDATFDLNGSGPFYGYINVYRTGQNEDENWSSFHIHIAVGCWNNGWGTYGAGGGWSANVPGWAPTGGLNLDFRPAGSSARRIDVFHGDFRVYHDANGYMNGFNSSCWIDSNHGSIGDGGATVAEGAAPRIAQRPYAPKITNIENVRPQSFGVRYAAGDDRGDAHDAFQVQWSRNSAFTDIVWTDNKSWGYTDPNDIIDLNPGTEYWVRVRGKNRRGWSDWSAAVSHKTLSGAYRYNGSQWVPQEMYYYDGDDWQIPLVQTRSADNKSWINTK